MSVLVLLGRSRSWSRGPRRATLPRPPPLTGRPLRRRASETLRGARSINDTYATLGLRGVHRTDIAQGHDAGGGALRRGRASVATPSRSRRRRARGSSSACGTTEASDAVSRRSPSTPPRASGRPPRLPWCRNSAARSAPQRRRQVPDGRPSADATALKKLKIRPTPRTDCLTARRARAFGAREQCGRCRYSGSFAHWSAWVDSISDSEPMRDTHPLD